MLNSLDSSVTSQNASLISQKLYDNTFHHVCLAADFSKVFYYPSPIGLSILQYGVSTLYVDGEAFPMTVTGKGLDDALDTIYIGATPLFDAKTSGFIVGYVDMLNGTLDELWLFNREITATEAAALAAKQLVCCGKNSSSTSVCSGRGSCSVIDKVCITCFSLTFNIFNCYLHSYTVQLYTTYALDRQ